MVSTVELEKSMVALRGRFEAGLDGRFRKLQQGLRDLMKNTENRHALEELHLEAHGLCGTARTFGFDELGRKARIVEQYSQGLMNGNRVLDETQLNELELMLESLIQTRQ